MSTTRWGTIRGLMVACGALLAAGMGSAAAQDRAVTLVQDGRAAMAIVAGSDEAPVQDLQNMVRRISDAQLQTTPAQAGATGIYVGTFADFPWLTLDNAAGLGPEGFIIRSDGKNLYLLGEGPLGVQHAVITFANRLGHRQFFPGPTWEVVPRLSTIQGAWDERISPHFSTFRKITISQIPPQRADVAEWMFRNRLGGPQQIQTGHNWYGLDPETNFEQHPEWFALRDREGKLVRAPSKPCFSHPEVIARIIENARRRASGGASAISMSPPDGLGYCQCEKCFAVFQGGEPFAAHSTFFAKRPDGVVVNVTSETLFAVVNKVAEALEQEFPNTLIACNAYSAYSHPPSFKMHRNVYINTATSFRRTPLALEEQLTLWGQRTSRLGIRGYWSVYQWDWDNPKPGIVAPHQLQSDIQLYAKNGATAIITEAGDNFAPRGLGYYIGAHLLWDPQADVDAMIRDFYLKSFGPAAEPMQRYYELWYGPQVVVLEGKSPTRTQEPIWKRDDPAASKPALIESFRHLDEAAKLVADQPQFRARVDHLRMYMYYMHLRLKQWEAAAANASPEAVLATIRDETSFGARLVTTNMIDSKSQLNSRFDRYYKVHEELLASTPDSKRGGPWRTPGTPPTHEELNTLWNNAKAELGM